MTRRPGGQRRPLPGSPFTPAQEQESRLEVTDGDRVTHDRHGLGRVLKVEDAEVIVDFGSTVRKLDLRDQKLSKL